MIKNRIKSTLLSICLIATGVATLNVSAEKKYHKKETKTEESKSYIDKKKSNGRDDKNKGKTKKYWNKKKKNVNNERKQSSKLQEYTIEELALLIRQFIDSTATYSHHTLELLKSLGKGLQTKEYKNLQEGHNALVDIRDMVDKFVILDKNGKVKKFALGKITYSKILGFMEQYIKIRDPYVKLLEKFIKDRGYDVDKKVKSSSKDGTLKEFLVALKDGMKTMDKVLKELKAKIEKEKSWR